MATGKSPSFATALTSSSSDLNSARDVSTGRAMTHQEPINRKSSSGKPEKRSRLGFFHRSKKPDKDGSSSRWNGSNGLQESKSSSLKSGGSERVPDWSGLHASGIAPQDDFLSDRSEGTWEGTDRHPPGSGSKATRILAKIPHHPTRGPGGHVSFSGKPRPPPPQTPQSSANQAPDIFSLDTNLTDMGNIVRQSGVEASRPRKGEAPSKIVIPNEGEDSSFDTDDKAWHAPESWDVKWPHDDVGGSPLSPVEEISQSPTAEAEGGKDYCMRIFRTDSTFATISASIKATVEDILQMLAKKSVLQDSIHRYHLVFRQHDLSRPLKNHEKPAAIQKRMLEWAGYQTNDRIEDVGREDNSYLCRFTFIPYKGTGVGGAGDGDLDLSKMQKFNHVNLEGRSLETIPIILFRKASEIISLNLSRNLGLKVPKDFVHDCINLREIKFIGNEAWRLPASLGWARRLTVLDVSNNRLEELDSAELGRLSALTSIKVANNGLTSLPSYFADFTNLRSLFMASNNLTKLPKLVTRMAALETLDISFNKIAELPNIGQATALERLLVTNNELKGPLDASFRALINLKELDVRFNGITNIDHLTELPRLETLNIGHNGLSAFSGSFPALRSLGMDHCPVTSFDIDRPMPTLLQLDLASAKLPSFKDSMFANIPQLQRLCLDMNHLINMPMQIGRLTRLEHFSITKNPLNTLPSSIGNLGELGFLNLRECNLKSLPSEIWHCAKLETLNVSSNVLESFPKMTAAPMLASSTSAAATTHSAGSGLGPTSSLEELGKLESFDHRRPSQTSGGGWSVTNSPAASSNRKASLASSAVAPAGNRKGSVLSKMTTAAADDSMTPATRNDSNISHARLSNTFAGSLRHLYLADNRLEDDVFWELSALVELRSLNLSYNELTDLPNRVFRRFAHLEALYLSGNKLTNLPSDDLDDGSKLRTLHLNANKFQVLPAELCKVQELAILDLGSNHLKYNISNWPYDWNWNYNPNLRYLNFSANRRLEIKPASQHQNAAAQKGVVDLTSFASLQHLRVLGLMDVTLTIPTTPEPSEDRRIRLSASISGHINYGVADTIGRHDHLSTLDMVVPRFRGREEETLVGMFDGQALEHGGSRVAKYLQESFRGVLIEELSKLVGTEDSPLDALRRTFLSLNRNMAQAASPTSHQGPADPRLHSRGNHRSTSVCQSLLHEDLTSGGVATVLYLHQTDLYVANVGDAQAMLIQNNAQHKFLTAKHDPTFPRERERIRETGRYVSRQGKLNDVLEVSRAFGYYHLMPSVNAAPHVLQVSLNDNDEMIVLASREFWRFVTPELAVDVARSEKADVMLAAQKLRDLAMAYGATDKIMVMVMGIGDVRKRTHNRPRGPVPSMQPGTIPDDLLFPSPNARKKRKGDGVGDSRLARLHEVEAPTGDVAIVFTDIKNSTALWEALPAAMRSAIQMHNELMRRQLRLIGGYEVKTEGDAFMVSFPNCTSALLWCFSCQSHLLELAWPTEILDTIHCQEKFDSDQNLIYRGLSVRMGIHYGRPVCEQDPITGRMDYFGPMVNRAARISAVADGGQVSASADFVAEFHRTLEAYADEQSIALGSEDTMGDDTNANLVREQLQQLSSQGYAVKDLGEKKLKGLENPEYVFLVYPQALTQRLTIRPGSSGSATAAAGAESSRGGGGGGGTGGDAGDRGKVPAESGTQPDDLATMGQDSELNISSEAAWRLWDLALRLEVLCSSLESPNRSEWLDKPELDLLHRMKSRGGELSDAFMLNLLDHQVTRVEVWSILYLFGDLCPLFSQFDLSCTALLTLSCFLCFLFFVFFGFFFLSSTVISRHRSGLYAFSRDSED